MLLNYIDEYYNLNYEKISKPPRSKYTNLNFSRLPADKKLVQISIDILLRQNLQIKEKIDWDLSEETKSPELFAYNLVDYLRDIIPIDLIEYNKTNIKNQILDQLLDHIEKNTFFPRLRLIKKENESSSNNQHCANCSSVIMNADNTECCVNCLFVFEKKIEKKNNSLMSEEDNRQTERQRMIELRQKNVNVDDIVVSLEAKEKKICKKCGEVNPNTVNECKECKFKFPLISYFDINMNQNYSVHFWDKVNKNNTIQQLKNLSDFFSQEDFCSLKYLYNKMIFILKSEYQKILTEEAFEILMQYLAKTYFAFSNPTVTVNILND